MGRSENKTRESDEFHAAATAHHSIGVLKSWDMLRGFGFIADGSGGPDMFLHITEVNAAGIDARSLAVGDRLTYEFHPTADRRRRALRPRLVKLNPGAAV